MNKLLIGVFDDEHKMIDAAKALKQIQIPIHDIYTPFPLHGIDDFLDIKRTRLPYVTLAAGLLGCSLALYAQYWISSIDWPINVGGKPFNSFPAFIPVAFEITILLGAFLTALSFFYKDKLFPKVQSEIIHPRASQDRFIVALKSNDASLDLERMEKFFKEKGAVEVELKEVDL